MENTKQLTIFIHHLTQKTIMNKTVKTILQVLGYIIAALLGGAGAQTLM